jgi:hypothetical protein
MSEAISWTPIDDLWSCEEETFVGEFETVRRSVSLEAYKSISKAAMGQDKLEPRLKKSESSRSASQTDTEPKKDVFGDPLGEKAHLIPQLFICAPFYGIFSQAILGVDLEKYYENNRPELIKALQQVVSGRVKEKRVQTGLRYSPLNLLMLPQRHCDFFDDRPVLVVVPILDLEKVKHWTEGEEYWVMFIAGRSKKDPDDYTNEYWYKKRIFAGNLDYEENKRERCDSNDINKATTLLSQFVKAHADVLTGRGGNRLTPLDLFVNDLDQEVNKRKNMLNDTVEKLRNNVVKVPVVKDNTGRNWEVMKIYLTVDIPDPALVATKAAINWSARCDQNLLPSCSDEPEGDPLEAELYEMAREEYEAAYEASIRASTPTRLAIGLSGSLRRVTLSPGEVDVEGGAVE